MFQGNKLVLILPGILMLVMLVGGYQFLQGSEAITNEELKDMVEYEAEIQETESGLYIDANWDWTIMPIEGLYGEDYLSVYFMDGDKVRTDVVIEKAELQLLHSDQIIEVQTGEKVANGVIFSFSNKIVEHESFGNLGQLQVVVSGTDLTENDVRIQLLHTWTEHAPLEKEDATFSAPTFTNAANVPYWIRKFQ